MPGEIGPCGGQQRKRDKKLHRCTEPQPIPDLCPVISERQRDGAGNHGKKSRLPYVIDQGLKLYWDHRLSSFLNRLCLPACSSAFRASRTSSGVSFPDSIRCVTIGKRLPPNSATRSSIIRCCADEREMTASKMWALLTLVVRRMAFLASRRYTTV